MSAFSANGRCSERLPSDRDDRVTLLLGRTTSCCRRLLWKRSSFPGPKCVWQPLLARMLFYSVSKCFATYVSWPSNTISIPSRSWSCSPSTHLVLLGLSPVKSACISIVFRLVLISHAILLASQLQACYLHLSVYRLTMQLKMYMDYFCWCIYKWFQ